MFKPVHQSPAAMPVPHWKANRNIPTIFFDFPMMCLSHLAFLTAMKTHLNSAKHRQAHCMEHDWSYWYANTYHMNWLVRWWGQLCTTPVGTCNLCTGLWMCVAQFHLLTLMMRTTKTMICSDDAVCCLRPVYTCVWSWSEANNKWLYVNRTFPQEIHSFVVSLIWLDLYWFWCI